VDKNPVGRLISRLQTGLSIEEFEKTERTDAGSETVDDGRFLPNGSRLNPGTDQLALAISDIASHFGTPTSPQSLSAGLPLVKGLLPLEHLEIAAAKANLAVEHLAGDPLNLSSHELPLLVHLSSGEVILLWEFIFGQMGEPVEAVLSIPGNPQVRERLNAGELKSSIHKIFRLHPRDGLDNRGREAIDHGVPKNWFLPAFRESRKIYAEAIGATIAINILGLSVPLFSMNVYDRVLPNAAEATLWALAIGVFIAVAFDFTLRTLRSHFVDAASRRADVRLSNLIFGRLMGTKLSAMPSSIGVRANTMREFETLREFINSATLTAFGDLPFLLLFITVMWVVAGPLAFVVVAAIPVILLVGWLTQRALEKLITQSFREAAQKNAVVVEAISGIETIKASGAESWAANKWERSVAEHVRLGLRIRHVTNLGQHTIQSIQTFLQVVIVVIGFYIVAKGQMTMGALIAATILSGRALQPLAQAANLLARLNQTRIAYRSLSEIVNAPQERPDGGVFLNKTSCEGHVTFEDCTFTYHEHAQPALSDFSMTISPGEHVAIIGGIGSGKTTALKLLQGLLTPTLGRVLLDGVSLGQIEPALLRQHVGLLLQDADLFHGTIRENITIADPSAGDDAIIKASHTAGALDWIVKLPQGFDTPVSERGSNLSGGQRQSLALARVLLRGPKVIALDEPTSNMDGRLEQQVISRLKAMAAHRTLIVVTHRPALLALVDRIVVIEGSRKIEDGPKDQVLAALKARTIRMAAKAKDKAKARQDTSAATTVKKKVEATLVNSNKVANISGGAQ